MEFVTHSREETVALGGRLADALKTGRVLIWKKTVRRGLENAYHIEWRKKGKRWVWIMM